MDFVWSQEQIAYRAEVPHQEISLLEESKQSFFEKKDQKTFIN